ncbi:hypothetical protein E4U21_003987 [Claviceps maximensis]|nr:hypothetical protein E4U21_003987 [Claviceps maximensis]
MSSAENHDHHSMYDKPVPRPARSPTKTIQIRIQNRRREYLKRHPAYFDSEDRELADPVLYERLVKRHQTPQERQAEGLRKGYARILEADLARGESRLSALATEAAGEQRTEFDAPSRWVPGPDVDCVWEEEEEEQGGNEGKQSPTTKDRGRALWREYLRERFIHGGDGDFRYGDVDDDDDLDGDARREAEERWFDDEEERWVVVGGGEREGETGVQDY